MTGEELVAAAQKELRADGLVSIGAMLDRLLAPVDEADRDNVVVSAMVAAKTIVDGRWRDDEATADRAALVMFALGLAAGKALAE